VCFGPFRLDLGSGCVWRGTEVIKLTPKAFTVLRYFVDRPGQLVSKVALFETVWPQTYVSDIALSVCIREIRKALNDDAKNPQFIETVHRRGYRFVARLIPASPVPSPEFRALSPFSAAVSHIVGREAELEQLHGWFEKAMQGERQIVFVSGEAGIGKTTLVETFVRTIEPAAKAWTGLGQCIQQYGAGEAYLPVFEALGRLCRLPEGQQLVGCLERYAPSWLVQMPGLLRTEELQQVRQRTTGTTQERMLREMAETLEAFSAQRMIILFLEDLHWSDTATLSLVSLLARRREPARLFVIGSYRPGDVLTDKHPLQRLIQELQLHGHCQELPVSGLSLPAVEAYCGQRFGKRLSQVSADAPILARTLHERTAGNPLFLAALADAIVRGEFALETAGQEEAQAKAAIRSSEQVPEVIRQIIERDIDRLEVDEQQLLEAASVAGVEFTAASVAAGVEKAEDGVEQQCAVLARRLQFIQPQAQSPHEEWPDGTLTTRYHFTHAIYQDVWYARIPAARRALLHRRIGEREEQGYQEQANTYAAQLAMHFERGREPERAIFYHQKAGENALRRSAHQEAIIHLTTGLSLLGALPDSRERGAQELALQNAVSIPLLALKGYGAPEAEHAYTRALALCQQVGETPLSSPCWEDS
jgi:predicted ATPase/DNA-binding winged helix-turn-helix (wHTH) protein